MGPSLLFLFYSGLIIIGLLDYVYITYFGGFAMSSSRIMKWITGSFEIFLGIPVLGGAFVLGLYWTPLFVMLILHIITLVLSKQNKEPIYGSVLGIVTSLVAWIPFVGMIMHIISGILLMVTAAQKPKQNFQHPHHNPYQG